jgi:hypothetical protein
MTRERVRHFKRVQMLWGVDISRGRWRRWPVITSACADCGIGTLTLGEWYIVHDAVWDEAWRGRRKWWHAIDGQEVLCIGCLERRLGRRLTASDFTAAPCNDPDKYRISPRLRARLIQQETIP